MVAPNPAPTKTGFWALFDSGIARAAGVLGLVVALGAAGAVLSGWFDEPERSVVLSGLPLEQRSRSRPPGATTTISEMLSPQYGWSFPIDVDTTELSGASCTVASEVVNRSTRRPVTYTDLSLMLPTYIRISEDQPDVRHRVWFPSPASQGTYYIATTVACPGAAEKTVFSEDFVVSPPP